MENTTEVRAELKTLYSDLKQKKVDHKTAKTMVSVTNSMLKSAALEMDHSKMIGDKREIKFLATPPFGRKANI